MTSTMGIYDVGDVYDTIYQGRGKDYRSEAGAVARHVRRRLPGARSVLDVGCGTGGHLVHLAEQFPDTHGIDLSEGMLDVARRELGPDAVSAGDMRSFRLGRRFDAVVCLFSAIGNLAGQDDLDAALATFAEHLEPGGAVVVEPWWFPENFTPGHIGSSLVTVGDRTVARVSHTVRHGPTASRMDVRYVVATPDEGVWDFADTHVMTLYGREQFERAFAAAGLSCEHVTGDYAGNGLFVGVRGGRS